MGIVERAVASADSGIGGAAKPVADHAPATARADAERRPSPADGSMTARDLKPIVQIDVPSLREAGRLPPENASRQTGNEIRRIKWPLLNNVAGRNGSAPARNNVILVTSALPGEGKTFVSLNLALSIVRDRELRVILVDGDVARPGLTPSLGLEGRPGLMDVLENPDLDISAATYQTDVDGLMVVPAGKWNERSPEYFAGSRMPQVIQDLIGRAGNGVVILDSPPLLATNEAQVVTRHVGQVLMVVRADRTEQRDVRDAVALVDQAATISAVLNAARRTLLGRYYGGNTYGYGYGYEPDAVPSRDQERGAER